MYSSALNPNNVPSGNAKYMKQWIQDYVNIETVRKCFRCGQNIFAGTAVYMGTDGRIYTYQTSEDDTYIGVAAENAKTNEFADVVLQGYLRVPGAPWVAGVLYYTNAVGILTPVPVTRRVAVGVGDNEIVVYTQLDPGISAMTADNGLNISAPGNVQLGGTLLQHTTIDTNVYTLYVNGNNDYAPLVGTNTGTGAGLVGNGIIGVQGDGTVSGGQFYGIDYGTYSEGANVGGYFSRVGTFRGVVPSSVVADVTDNSFAPAPWGVTGPGYTYTFNGTTAGWTNVVHTDETAGARKFRWDVYLWDEAAVSTNRLFSINTNGKAELPKYGVGTFAATPTYLLGVDASGNVNETSFAGLISASNGLTESPTNTIILGGTLTQNTTVNGGAYYTRFTSTAASTQALYGSNIGTNGIGVKGLGSIASGGIGVVGTGYHGFEAQVSTYGFYAQGNTTGFYSTIVCRTGGDFYGFDRGVRATSTSLTTSDTAPIVSVVDNNSTGAIDGDIIKRVYTTYPTAITVGTGVGHYFIQPDGAGNDFICGVTGVRYTNVGIGTEATSYEINLYKGGAPVFNTPFKAYSNGQIQFPLYGSETFTNTVTNTLGVSASGYVVEEPVCYLSAADVSDQTAAAATATPMEFDTTNLNYNITITGVNNTDITLPKAGIYNIQFSAQMVRTSGGTGTVSVWLAKYNSGTGLWDNVPNSNTDYQISGNNEPFVAILNFLESATLNDKYRIYWSSSDGNVQLEYKAAQVSPDRPVTPSIILTVWKIA